MTASAKLRHQGKYVLLDAAMPRKIIGAYLHNSHGQV
jgi:hypothetical protein